MILISEIIKEWKFPSDFLTTVIPNFIIVQASPLNSNNWAMSPGIIGTLVLIFIVLFVACIIFLAKLNGYVDSLKTKQIEKKKLAFNEELLALEESDIDQILDKRKKALKYKLSGTELGSQEKIVDEKGLVNRVSHEPENPMFDEKKKTPLSIETPERLKKIIIYYLGAAVCWLVFGTLVGQYVGMKFIWPEMDNLSWLSFGRLRPVHTNAVFWGWASLAMIGLGYFVIARTSNTIIHSYAIAWRAWILINLTVLLGTISLMSGINNGGGEYREYIWPVMLLFAIGLVITFWNFYRTVASRKISDIYVSNW